MSTITQIAASDIQFSILVDTLKFIDANIADSDLVGTLNDASQSLTVFAPTNAAFGLLAKDLGFTGDVTDAAAVTGFLVGLGAETLNSVVLYHVAAGTLKAADVAAADNITTLQGGTIGTNDLPTLVDREPDLPDPSLSATDVIADNGVVHVIDRVLLPVDFPDNDAPTITGLVLQSGEGFDSNGSDFDILRESVVAANLADTLNDATADLTVFAPNDAAFVSLAQALGYSGSDEAGAFSYIVDALELLNGGDSAIELLSTILTYHVAAGSLQKSEVVAAGEVTTLQGGELKLDGTSLVDADPDLGDPSLIATDIQTSNGIVHVIDGVLLPVDVLATNGANDVRFVIGTESADEITTGADNDLVSGKGGDDTFMLGGGNDTVLGGGGIDTVVADGARTASSVSISSTGTTLSSSAGGSDVLRGVERIEFSDGILAIDLDGNAGQAYRLYQAAFNRTPDNDGLKSWVAVLDGGTDFVSVAKQFIGSSEFASIYGANPSNSAFVDALYMNILGRDGEEGGVNFWNSTLESGQFDFGDVLARFSESAENIAGVAPSISDGIFLT